MNSGIPRALVTALLLAGVQLAGALPAQAAMNTNLVVDGDAEAVAPNNSPTAQVVPGGWSTTGSFSVRAYGTSGGFPDQADSDAINGGSNFFDGGSGAGTTATATQTIDLSADATAIDSGAIEATLSAALGGFTTDDDNAKVTVAWLNANGNETGAPLVVGPVTPGDRDNETKLLPQTSTTTVPGDARRARVVVTATRISGAANDGYADNISLALTDPRSPSGGGGGSGSGPPLDFFPPAIVGEVRSGQTIGCTPGVWTDDPAFAYQWTRDGTPIGGATGQTYAIARADLRRELSCTVTATASGGTATATTGPLTVLPKLPCAEIGGVCPRSRAACKPKYKKQYAVVGFECKRRGRKRLLVKASEKVQRGKEPVLLGANGKPSLASALQAFDKFVAPLPGVKQKPGVVGTATDGTSAITWLRSYRSKLTPAQRRAFDEYVRPPEVSKADDSPAIQTYKNLAAEGTQRLAAHGIQLQHPVRIRAVPQGDDPTVFANTSPSFLYGEGDFCLISITPKGERTLAVSGRDTLAHEMIHCAQGEAAGSAQVDEAMPQWVVEGEAGWGGGRLGLEWQGTMDPTSIGYLQGWVLAPAKDLFTRSYNAAGWFQLLEHEGGDPWKLLQPLARTAGTLGANAAYLYGLSNAGPTTLSSWGTTMALTPDLGEVWDLKAPGAPSFGELNKLKLRNGGALPFTVAARGAAHAKVSISADVVEIEPGGGEVGLFRNPRGEEGPINAGTYCAKSGGCDCPDGREDTLPPMGQGDAYIGFMSQDKTTLTLRGESLEDYCGKPPDNGILILRDTSFGSRLEGVIKSGNCRKGKGGFTAQARTKDKVWSLKVGIKGFRGFGPDYNMAFGGPDPSFTLNGPGGPFSNAFAPGNGVAAGAIHFSPSGDMGFGFSPAFNSGLSSTVSIAGGMKCVYPKPKRRS